MCVHALRVFAPPSPRLHLLPGLVDDLVVLVRLLQRQLQLGKVLLEAIQLYAQSFALRLRLLQDKSSGMGWGRQCACRGRRPSGRVCSTCIRLI